MFRILHPCLDIIMSISRICSIKSPTLNLLCFLLFSLPVMVLVLLIIPHMLYLEILIAFTFGKLMTGEVKEICPSGILQVIFLGTTLLHRCPAVILNQIEQIATARLHFYLLGRL